MHCKALGIVKIVFVAILMLIFVSHCFSLYPYKSFALITRYNQFVVLLAYMYIYDTVCIHC